MRILFVATLLVTLILPCWAGPPPFEELPLHQPLQYSRDIRTQWGYGPRENSYNELIVDSVEERWQDQDRPLAPKTFKALIAVESAFRPTAVSRTGAAGLVQLTHDTARRFGLVIGPSDPRMEPAIAVPVGVSVLAEKHQVLLEPANYYGILLGRPDKRCDFGEKVARAYEVFGLPEYEDAVRLNLAAFNGGGGTVMRAMARAYDMGLDPRDWEALVGDEPSRSPLFYACRQIYRHGAPGKYREMSNYPKKILKLTDQ